MVSFKRVPLSSINTRHFNYRFWLNTFLLDNLFQIVHSITVVSLLIWRMPANRRFNWRPPLSFFTSVPSHPATPAAPARMCNRGPYLRSASYWSTSPISLGPVPKTWCFFLSDIFHVSWSCAFAPSQTALANYLVTSAWLPDLHQYFGQ